jgi:hypothetical protein
MSAGRQGICLGIAPRGVKEVKLTSKKSKRGMLRQKVWRMEDP